MQAPHPTNSSSSSPATLPSSEYCKVAADAAANSSQSSPTYTYTAYESKQSPDNSASHSMPNVNCYSPKSSLSPTGSCVSGSGSSLQDQTAYSTSGSGSDSGFQSQEGPDSSTSDTNLDQMGSWSMLPTSVDAGSGGSLDQSPLNSLPSFPHITNGERISNDQILLQRVQLNEFQNRLQNSDGTYLSGTKRHSLTNFTDAFPFNKKFCSSQPEAPSRSRSSGNSSGSDEDERIVEFTEAFPSNLMGVTSSANVSELWLELPNLESVCRYCFKSPCLCFGVPKF